VVTTEFTRDAASFRTDWPGVSPFVTVRAIRRGTFLFLTTRPVKKDDVPLTDNKGIGFIGSPSRSWGRRMRTTNNKAARALHNAIAGAAGVLALALILTGIVRVAHGSPHVGDIVAFVPSMTAHAGKGTRLLVHRQDQFGCVLDLNVLRQSGGSLIVETQFGAGASGFRVHWAGVRTSEDPGNCGSDADLIVDHSDLDRLSLSAGGYGVGS
jgi:hypothetical protein